MPAQDAIVNDPGKKRRALLVELGEEIGNQLPAPVSARPAIAPSPPAAARRARRDVDGNLDDRMRADVKRRVRDQLGTAEHADRDGRPDDRRGDQSPLDGPHHPGVLGFKPLELSRNGLAVVVGQAAAWPQGGCAARRRHVAARPRRARARVPCGEPAWLRARRARACCRSLPEPGSGGACSALT